MQPGEKLGPTQPPQQFLFLSARPMRARVYAARLIAMDAEFDQRFVDVTDAALGQQAQP